ncbi:MAG: chorismate-binding protein [Sandaracinaceae bacterium]|jgi:anthranilate synthase component 1|nr:chorismate-binding protein [Sandaracinaceae bacterium]MBK7153821.1 chorismate-binding protein [Sandaracinaceae bacterium]MBK7775319.1 chorismate-binding protein [Sandaracinaceae bacterium]
MPASVSLSLDQFRALAREPGVTVIPLFREILADVVTPVVAQATLGSAEGSFLLESVVGGEKWARYSFVGFDPQRIVRGVANRFETVVGSTVTREDGIDPLERLRETLAEYVPPREVEGLPRFWGGAVGYVTYDAVRRFEPKVGAALGPDDEWEFCFGIGGTLLIFDSVKQVIKVVAPAHVPAGADVDAAYHAAVARVEGAIAQLATPRHPRPLSLPERPSLELPPSNFERARFEAAVVRAQEYIRAGDIFQVVLSQRFRVPLTPGFDVYDVYRAMRSINPSPYMYFLRFSELQIAGASPETLVRLEDGVVSVRPIAGTRHRGATAEEDQAIAEELLADPKERAEHVMLVDLGRNDVGRISGPGEVRVTDQMMIERYSHVMHIVSNVEGKLAAGSDALDVLRATFPAGTLSGAPKVRAMQIIEELEPERRGVYGGAVGYIGFDGNMDVAIAIRTVVARDGALLLQAGAGVVEASVPASEWQETVNKARAGLVALSVGVSGAKQG